MKKGARITGTVLILMIAGTLTLSAQRGMRGNNDFQRMGRPGTDTLMRRGRLPLAATDTLFVHRRMQGNMMAGMPGRGLGHRYQMIPNLTEKQTKDIEALNKKNSDEMTKFREENQKKIQTMREEHRKQILNLLTDEQKKVFESFAPPKAEPAKPAAPAKPASNAKPTGADSKI